MVVLAATDEESSGDGAKHFTQHLPLRAPSGGSISFGACIVSEPSSNRVMLGHCGVMRAFVRFHGRAHHASLAHTTQERVDVAEIYAAITILTSVLSGEIPA